MGTLRQRLTYPYVVSTLALFVALGGSAYAVSELDKNEVKSKHIKNAGVKTKDLANDAVSSPKVANGSLLGEDFAASQLPQGPMGPEGPRGADGAPGTPGTPGTPGAPGATNTLARVATCTITSNNTEQNCSSPSCTAAEELTGGGASLRNFNSTVTTYVTESYPENTSFSATDESPSQWHGGAINNSGADRQLTVWAICATP